MNEIDGISIVEGAIFQSRYAVFTILRSQTFIKKSSKEHFLLRTQVDRSHGLVDLLHMRSRESTKHHRIQDLGVARQGIADSCGSDRRKADGERIGGLEIVVIEPDALDQDLLRFQAL